MFEKKFDCESIWKSPLLPPSCLRLWALYTRIFRVNHNKAVEGHNIHVKKPLESPQCVVPSVSKDFPSTLTHTFSRPFSRKKNNNNSTSVNSLVNIFISLYSFSSIFCLFYIFFSLNIFQSQSFRECLHFSFRI